MYRIKVCTGAYEQCGHMLWGEHQVIIWKALDLVSSAVQYILYNKYKIKERGKTATHVWTLKLIIN